MDVKGIEFGLSSLCILGDIRERGVFPLIIELVRAVQSDAQAFARAYGALVSYTLEHGCINDCVMHELLLSDNLFARESCAKELSQISDTLKAAAVHDVRVLSDISSKLRGERVLADAKARFTDFALCLDALPHFESSGALPLEDERDLYNFYRRNRYGFFAVDTAYIYRDKELTGIKYPDGIRLSDLKGYQRQKDIIIRNTKLFLSGGNANNILLYGDKGTGKSSTVKAVLNEFSAQGLRLIELRKEDAEDFYDLCVLLSQSPFKFIIFLDDISFASADDRFGALKAMLEGGVLKRPDNVVLYATSNRRHLVAEKFSDRDGDDLHVRDTIESITALSDRFGIELVFSAPDKDEYLYIVEALARESGIDIQRDELLSAAERFALTRGGRSPRGARQFISSLHSQKVI